MRAIKLRALPLLAALACASTLLAACGGSATLRSATPFGNAIATPSGGANATDQPYPGPSASEPAATSAPVLDQTAYPPPEGSTAVPVQAPTTAATQAQPQTSAPAKPQPAGDAQSFPDPAGYQWKPVVSGMFQPVGLFTAGDGSGRLFIILKRGQIVIARNGQLNSQPFLDITNRVGSRGSEQGLLGLAFDPKYKQNGRFYVNYTDLNGNTMISRFTVPAGSPDAADPNSEKVILQQQQPFANHNGGELVFGPDGYLYIGLGDGGSQGDPNNNGQSLDTFLGKLLRIDVSGDGYKIPPDNPFVGSSHKAEIWAFGLRNPWRFSFDRKTNDLYIADVGQDLWEEIDFLPAGSKGGTNFGWSYKEATHPYKGQPSAGLKLVDPVAEYGHDQGCSVSGGYVYRGSMPEWQGIYLFGDYCSGKVWGLLRAGGNWQTQELFDTHFAISSFGQDENGEVYLVDINGNVLELARN